MPLPAPISSFETIIGPLELDSGAGTTLLYTAPGLRRISDIYLTQDSNPRDVNLYIVPPGDAPASANRLLDEFATIANDVRMIVGLNYAINTGWTIYADVTGSGTKLVVIAYR